MQELRAQFNNLMHNATTSPRNRRSILKDLEVRMIELEDQDADPQEIVPTWNKECDESIMI